VKKPSALLWSLFLTIAVVDDYCAQCLFKVCGMNERLAPCSGEAVEILVEFPLASRGQKIFPFVYNLIPI
jgi:hypothetical protein